MLWLYWMGQIFEEYLGNKRTIGLYLLGGLTGGLLFVACYNLIPAFTNVNAAATSVVVGASASVMAIVVATATLLPDYTIPLMIIGPVKLKWIALFYSVIDFLGIAGTNAGGEIAHLGGALFGFIYIKQLQRGHDWIGGINKLFSPKPKMKVVSNSGNQRKASGTPRQEDVDRILDKISGSGYDSLTKQEKKPYSEQAITMRAKKRKLSFIDSVFLWINYLLCLALLLCYLAPFVDPRKFWPIAFFGLAYPPLLVANLLIMAYWLIRKSWYIGLSVITILIGWNVLMNNVGIRLPSSASSAPSLKVIRVMTYNVHDFKRYGAKNDISTKHEILDLIGQEQPDIIGIQEFFTRKKGEYDMVDSVKRVMRAEHYYFEPTMTSSSESIGMAIFSKVSH
jgi:hypothetical protein